MNMTLLQSFPDGLPVLDLHCDTALELYLQNKSLDQNDLQIDLRRAPQTPRTLLYQQVFGFCCVYDREGKPRPQAEAERLLLDSLAYFRAELAQNRDRIVPAGALADDENRNKAAARLSLEGPEAIGCDPARLEWLRAQGFEMTTLTWNFPNALAGSCMTGEGLTDRGREFVRQAQRLGIAIDVSHLSERAFWGLVDITTKPILASHSNSRACCAHARNLTDDQFRAIRDLGGVVGMNLYTPFLHESGRAGFDDIRRHLDHWLSLDGEKTVALGGDLDGCDTLPDGFTGIESYFALGKYLHKRGYPDDLILDLFHNNASAALGRF